VRRQRRSEGGGSIEKKNVWKFHWQWYNNFNVALCAEQLGKHYNVQITNYLNYLWCLNNLRDFAIYYIYRTLKNEIHCPKRLGTFYTISTKHLDRMLNRLSQVIWTIVFNNVVGRLWQATRILEARVRKHYGQLFSNAPNDFVFRCRKKKRSCLIGFYYKYFFFIIFKLYQKC
jgi:hypothetical protein